MSDQKTIRRHGLSLRRVIIAMFIVCAAVSGLLLSVTYIVKDRYSETSSATQDYLTCQENAYLIQETIRELSERARNFAVTGNPEEVIYYYNEEQVQRSIETAREGFEGFELDETILKHLDTAIQLNLQMAEQQHYAMRLAVEGYGYNVEKYPEDLEAVVLRPEDEALAPEQKVARALEMLYSRHYSLLKNQVDIRIALCRNMLVAFMNERHQESLADMSKLLVNQRVLIVIMVCTLLTVMLYVLARVVRPINRFVSSIREKQRIPVQGLSELRYLAETYNQNHEEIEEAYSQISYEASHDALTGLYNRSAYDAARRQLGGTNIALLLVDIDYFKEVNDLNGHDVGDKVLKRVAGVLLDSFRDADRVCRIGGDEFAVIMMGATSAVVGVIRKKIDRARKVLSTPDGDIPAVTVSVGCAFSDNLSEGESLFKNADRALYQVKQNGRNDLGFFHVDMDELDEIGERTPVA